MGQSGAKLWAKSPDKVLDNNGEGESLLQHSLNVAKNAQLICDRLPFSSEVRQELSNCLIEAGVFHDLGKAASGFQRMLREKNFYWKHRHETLSTALAYALNPSFDECALFAVLTHHRNIPEGQIKTGEKCLPDDEIPAIFTILGNDAVWNQMLKELRENWEDFEKVLVAIQQQHNFTWEKISPTHDLLDFGIKKKFLWRDSQKQAIAKEKRWRASLLRGLLITSDHLASAVDPQKGEHPDILCIPQLIQLEDVIKQKELPANVLPLPYQQKAAEIKGNAILKAPTGAGKTLAALLWASRNQSENGRFFYVLPFTASINAMAHRLNGIFGSPNVGVLHHKNADYLFRLMEKDEMSLQSKNEQAKHLKSLAKEMYHPIRVSTPHQILRFALRGRGWETGLAEFVNACIVFDEVHAFEPLITGLTLATAKLLQGEPFNTKILFTSATIPAFLEKLIKDYLDIDEFHLIQPDPNNPDDAIVTDKKRHKIEVRAGNLLNHLSIIVDEIEAVANAINLQNDCTEPNSKNKEDEYSVLIFCNHVKTSQQVYDELKNYYGFTDVTLLHSRFNGRDRINIETKITRKKSKEEKADLKELIASDFLNTPILVATQAVEVSLDIDYGRGYSEPAPADALGQRLGRVNRKGARPPAPIIVFEEPTNGHLYDEILTNKTVELLKQLTTELSEQELTIIVDKVYEDGYSAEAQAEFEKGLTNSSIKNFAEELLAGTHAAWTDVIFEQTDAQIEVLPQSLFDEFSELRKERLNIKARQLFVPIRWGQYHKAKSMNAIRFDEKLREYVVTLAYDESKGLDSDRLDQSNIC